MTAQSPCIIISSDSEGDAAPAAQPAAPSRSPQPPRNQQSGVSAQPTSLEQRYQQPPACVDARLSPPLPGCSAAFMPGQRHAAPSMDPEHRHAAAAPPPGVPSAPCQHASASVPSDHCPARAGGMLGAAVPSEGAHAPDTCRYAADGSGSAGALPRGMFDKDDSGGGPEALAVVPHSSLDGGGLAGMDSEPRGALDEDCGGGGCDSVEVPNGAPDDASDGAGGWSDDDGDDDEDKDQQQPSPGKRRATKEALNEAMGRFGSSNEDKDGADPQPQPPPAKRISWEMMNLLFPPGGEAPRTNSADRAGAAGSAASRRRGSEGGRGGRAAGRPGDKTKAAPSVNTPCWQPSAKALAEIDAMYPGLSGSGRGGRGSGDRGRRSGCGGGGGGGGSGSEGQAPERKELLLGEALDLGPGPLPPGTILRVMGGGFEGPAAELLLCYVRRYIKYLRDELCADVLWNQRKECAVQNLLYLRSWCKRGYLGFGRGDITALDYAEELIVAYSYRCRGNRVPTLLQIVEDMLPDFPSHPLGGRYTIGTDDPREPLRGQLGIRNIDDDGGTTIKLGEFLGSYRGLHLLQHHLTRFLNEQPVPVGFRPKPPAGYDAELMEDPVVRRAAWVYHADTYLITLEDWCPVDAGKVEGDDRLFVWDFLDLPESVLALKNMAKDKWEVHVNPSAGFDGNDMCLVNDGKTDDIGGAVGEENCAPYEVMAFVVPQKAYLRRQQKQRQEGSTDGSDGVGEQQGVTKRARQEGSSTDTKPVTKQRPPRAADGQPKGADGLPSAARRRQKGGKAPGLDPLVCGWAFPLMIAVADIPPGDNFRYTYGTPYWDGQADKLVRVFDKLDLCQMRKQLEGLPHTSKSAGGGSGSPFLKTGTAPSALEPARCRSVLEGQGSVHVRGGDEASLPPAAGGSGVAVSTAVGGALLHSRAGAEDALVQQQRQRQPSPGETSRAGGGDADDDGEGEDGGDVRGGGSGTTLPGTLGAAHVSRWNLNLPPPCPRSRPVPPPPLPQQQQQQRQQQQQQQQQQQLPLPPAVPQQLPPLPQQQQQRQGEEAALSSGTGSLDRDEELDELTRIMARIDDFMASGLPAFGGGEEDGDEGAALGVPHQPAMPLGGDSGFLLPLGEFDDDDDDDGYLEGERRKLRIMEKTLILMERSLDGEEAIAAMDVAPMERSFDGGEAIAAMDGDRQSMQGT